MAVASQWNASKPAMANQISADVLDIEENFEEIERILECITNGTLGTTNSDEYGVDVITLGSDADGDIYYRASSALARLAKGTIGQSLVMNSGATAPEWGSADLLKIGALGRSLFTYKDADEIYIEGGWYDIRGTANKIVHINSQITFQEGSGGSNSDSSDLTNAWHYIYIDYSAIPADNVLTAAAFMNHTTAPTWSAAKGGWYGTAVGNLTVNDRCIFAIYGDATPDITEFHHSNNTVMWADQVASQASVDIDNAFTDLGALRIPAFAINGIVSFQPAIASGADLDGWWRTNGQTGGTGHICVFVKNANTNMMHNSLEVITDSNQVIEFKYSASDNCQIQMWTNGWKFPVGM